jgi:hypothetical protein
MGMTIDTEKGPTKFSGPGYSHFQFCRKVCLSVKESKSILWLYTELTNTTPPYAKFATSATRTSTPIRVTTLSTNDPQHNAFKHLVTRDGDGAASVLERGTEFGEGKVERSLRDVRDRADHTGNVSSNELVEQAKPLSSSGIIWNLAILNDAEGSLETEEIACSNVSTEELGVRKVHLQNLIGDVHASVRLYTAEPVLRNPLGDVGPSSWCVRVLDSTEEALHRGEIRRALVSERGEELVQEGRGSVKKERQGSKVEVGVLTDRLVVALGSVCGDGVEVVEAAGDLIGSGLHLSKESSIEGVVVAEEVVGTGERAVTLKLDVCVETTLAA